MSTILLGIEIDDNTYNRTQIYLAIQVKVQYNRKIMTRQELCTFLL